jgi:hypothetical protein
MAAPRRFQAVFSHVYGHLFALGDIVARITDAVAL